MDTDINYIIQKSIEGDKKYQEVLLKRLKPLIFKTIYRFYSLDDSIVEDLIQEGYIIILESLIKYETNYNVHFLGFIKSKLYFYYKNYHRNTKQLRQNLSLNKKISDSEDSAEFGDIIESKNYNFVDSMIKNEEIIEMIKYFNSLNMKDKEILILYYNNKLSMKEISNKLNIAYRTAISRKYTALLKLKNCMNIQNRGD